MKLPIEVLPTSHGPPMFKWRQRVTSPIGETWIEHTGTMPLTVERAVADLVGIAGQLARENAALRAENEQLRGRQKAEGSDGKG